MTPPPQSIFFESCGDSLKSFLKKNSFRVSNLKHLNESKIENIKEHIGGIFDFYQVCTFEAGNNKYTYYAVKNGILIDNDNNIKYEYDS